MALQHSGKIVLAGNANPRGYRVKFAVARYDSK
jgi:hypothetical protein